jgi:thiol-disulfide isomerase/thioredoxin
MTAEPPEILDALLPNATPPLRSVRRTSRTFRAFVRGAGAVAAFLLVASTVRAQDEQEPPAPTGWLGVGQVVYGTSGAVVGFVNPAGPAKKAGLVAGDTIISFNSMDATKENLHKLLTPGTPIAVHLRHNKERTVTVVVEGVEQTPAELPTVGKPAPQLALERWLNVPAGKTLGKTTTFGDGHVYILDFTATWCGGCPTMYPIMSELQQKYAAQGIRVIYVTAIWGYDKAENGLSLVSETPAQEFKTLSQYIAKHHMSSPVAVFANESQIAISGYFDRLKSKNEGSSGYDLSIPRTFLIDGTGNVRAAYEGQGENFMKEVASAVAASHPATP